MTWQKEALCEGDSDDLAYDPAFFENYENDLAVREKVDDLCSDCPVKKQCLATAISWSATGVPATGVFGGIYLELGYYDRMFNKHKPLQQRKQEEELVKEIRRGMRQKDV